MKEVMWQNHYAEYSKVGRYITARGNIPTLRYVTEPGQSIKVCLLFGGAEHKNNTLSFNYLFNKFSFTSTVLPSEKCKHILKDPH